MATHSSILAWEIPWTEKSVRLWSMGSQRVRHNLATKTTTTTTASLFIFDICRYTKEESRERCFGEGLTHTKLHVIFQPESLSTRSACPKPTSSNNLKDQPRELTERSMVTVLMALTSRQRNKQTFESITNGNRNAITVSLVMRYLFLLTTGEIMHFKVFNFLFICSKHSISLIDTHKDTF